MHGLGQRCHPDRLAPWAAGPRAGREHREAVLAVDRSGGDQRQVVDAGDDRVDLAHRSASSSRLSANLSPTTSLHSPTALTPTSRATARHSAESGFVTLRSSASGVRAPSSGRSPADTGTLRSAPADAARADAVTDRLADAVAGGDLEVVAHAREPAHRERGDRRTRRRRDPRRDRSSALPSARCRRHFAMCSATSSIGGSESGSTSIKVTVGVLQRLGVGEVESSRGVQCVLPPPTMVIRGVPMVRTVAPPPRTRRLDVQSSGFEPGVSICPVSGPGDGRVHFLPHADRLEDVLAATGGAM